MKYQKIQKNQQNTLKSENHLLKENFFKSLEVVGKAKQIGLSKQHFSSFPYF